MKGAPLDGFDALRCRSEAWLADLDGTGPLGDPEARFVAGVIGVAVGVVLMLFDGGMLAGRLCGWIGFMIVAALLLLVTGAEGVRRRSRRRGEVTRALREWPELVANVPRQANVSRWLRGRGYREFEVRRWIKREAARWPVGAE
ncbi:MAG: hypothetical protein JNK78_01625 [Planctomycetes bacterium]|nr:hypothetical protein [Planctomycetota bacterium]